MKTLRYLVAVPLAVAMILSTAISAGAFTPEFGISQSYRNFGLKVENGPYNPNEDVSRSIYWGPLNVPRLRVVIPWDIAERSSSDPRRQEFQHWLNRATALGAEPFVVFAPTERSPSVDAAHSPAHFSPVTTYDATNKHFIAPSGSIYKIAVQDFLATWGPNGTDPARDVKEIGAWNEPNRGDFQMAIPPQLEGQVYLPGNTYAMNDISHCPTGATTSNCGPLLAAWYWEHAVEAMIERCGFGNGNTCKIVAGEFASSAGTDKGSAWPYWNTYANKIESIGPFTPEIISFHAHRDAEELGANITESGANHDCKAGQTKWCVTTTFRQWMDAFGWSGLVQIWNTETGARHLSGTSPSGPDTAQNNRFNWMMQISDEANVRRLYYFNFQGSGADRGLIDDGSTVDTRNRPIWNTIRCRHTPASCPAWTPPPPPLSGGSDFSGDGKWDLVVRKPDGSLWMYRGNGAGGWISGDGEWIGAGFDAFNTVFVSLDFSGDGKTDLIGRKPDGSLWMYRGNGAGGWITGNGEWIGTGFQVYDALISRGDFSGDGKTDLIGRKPDGSLWMYRGNGAGGWITGNSEWIGAGFEPFDVLRVAGDFSGDGKTDLIARKPDGSLWVIKGNGAGGWITGNAEWIGAGFQSYEKFRLMDFSGDGRTDLIARKSDGSLWMYRGNGAGGWISGDGEWIGAGFQIYDFFSEG
jgi:hypothetical protein